MADTLKGAALIGQAGGPTCVINQSLIGYAEAALAAAPITAVLGARHGVAGVLAEDFLDLSGQVDRFDAVANAPGAALGSVRKKPTEEECARMVELFRKHDIRYFFYIGGNDSAETAHIVQGIVEREGYDMRLFHIPKTIDNDLRVTDHCPGFGSAARFVAHAFQGDDCDNRSLKGIKINVVMGRHAGFLTAAAALGRGDESDGPHLIYLPERIFDPEKFIADVDAVFTKHGRCVIAVSEGIHDAEGTPFVQVYSQSSEVDSHGNVQLSGTGALGDALAALVKAKLGDKLRVRADTFGYLQRSFLADVSLVDAAEAREAGRFGVHAATAGEFSSGSVALRRTGEGTGYASECFITPLDTVARVTKSMPDEFIQGDNDVTEAFLDYAGPLAGGVEPVGRFA